MRIFSFAKKFVSKVHSYQRVFKKDNPYCIEIKDIDDYYGRKIDNLLLIEKIKVIETKKGDKMAFVTGSDETGSKEFIFFPKVYRNYEQLEKGLIIKTRGRVEKRLDETQIIVEKVKILQGENNE